MYKILIILLVMLPIYCSAARINLIRTYSESDSRIIYVNTDTIKKISERCKQFSFLHCEKFYTNQTTICFNDELICTYYPKSIKQTLLDLGSFVIK